MAESLDIIGYEFSKPFFNINLNDKVNFFVELMDSNHSVKSEVRETSDKIELGSHYLVGLKFKL